MALSPASSYHIDTRLFSEDGRIILHDMREHPQYSQTQRTLQHDAEFTSVQYHPTMTHIFATSDNRGQLCLRDVRMAFGPLSQRRQQGIVHKVSAHVSRSQDLSPSSVCHHNSEARHAPDGQARSEQPSL